MKPEDQKQLLLAAVCDQFVLISIFLCSPELKTGILSQCTVSVCIAHMQLNKII